MGKGRTAAVMAATGAVVASFRAVQFRKIARQGFTVDEVPKVGEPEFARLLEALTDSPVTAGNRVSVLRNGCRIFPAMLEAIRGAEHSIDFATYVYWKGAIADEIAEALCERARAGVEVNVLLDAIGAAPMDRTLVRSMEEAGVTVAWFRPPRWYNLYKLNNRTHRKLLIVDGRVGFTGGVGIAEEWTGDCEDPRHWRDTHVRVEGPAVRGLYGGFHENWSEATRIIPTTPHLPPLEDLPDGVLAQVTRSSVTRGNTAAEELFYSAISAARDRLWLTTAYFAPREAFADALVEAARRGVDVRVLVNGPHMDRRVVRHAGRRFYETLLNGGVRIFEYQKTMLHAKVMTVDGNWSTVGSINLDNRSFALNDELNISFYDVGITAELDEHFEQDLIDAEEIDPGRWADRSLRVRTKELAAGAVRKQL